jgi:hypothetical protein
MFTKFTSYIVLVYLYRPLHESQATDAAAQDDMQNPSIYLS